MHNPTDTIAHTTAFVTPVVEHWLEREIAQWVHPMKDRSNDPSHHERTLLTRSYISLLKNNNKIGVLTLAGNMKLMPPKYYYLTLKFIPRLVYPIMILNIVSTNTSFPLGKMIGTVRS